jgi:hypothetical protein
MIEHADAALAAWFATLDPPVDVSFERADAGAGPGASLAPGESTGKRGGSSSRPTVYLSLSNVREQHDKRDNQIDDIRSEGRVIGRQRATRFFELDYSCTVGGPAGDAHRALGAVLQLLVDHDVVPAAHVPEPLGELGYPIDIHLVASPLPAAALMVRLTLPVQPTPSTNVGPPTRSLHLDMAPPPHGAGGMLEPASDPDLPPVGERRWTTVRRRELIGSQPSVIERHDTTGTVDRSGGR